MATAWFSTVYPGRAGVSQDSWGVRDLRVAGLHVRWQYIPTINWKHSKPQPRREFMHIRQARIESDVVASHLHALYAYAQALFWHGAYATPMTMYHSGPHCTGYTRSTVNVANRLKVCKQQRTGCAVALRADCLYGASQKSSNSTARLQSSSNTCVLSSKV